MTQRPSPLHVLLVEDHAPTLAVATLALRAAHHVVRTATTLAGARPLIAAHGRLDVCVLDLGLPDGDGLALLPLLKRRAPPVAVVVLSVQDDPPRILAALASGADGYLLKDDMGLQLVEAIQHAADGGMPMTREVATLVRHNLQNAARVAEPCPLTAAERDVLAGFARGLSYETVGEEMGISINTVRTYVRSVHTKLHVQTKTAAVLRALRAGWIPAPPPRDP